MEWDVFKNIVNADKIKSFKTFSYDRSSYKISYIKGYRSGCVKNYTMTATIDVIYFQVNVPDWEQQTFDNVKVIRTLNHVESNNPPESNEEEIG